MRRTVPEQTDDTFSSVEANSRGHTTMKKNNKKQAVAASMIIIMTDPRY
jgi:hypothetical protein